MALTDNPFVNMQEQLRVASRAVQSRHPKLNVNRRPNGTPSPEAKPSVVIGPNNWTSTLGLFNTYAPMAYMVPFEMLDFIELLAVYNPDYSQAVENVRTLANPGHTLLVDATKGVAKGVAQQIHEKNQVIQRRNGGIEGLIDKLLWQAAVYGAMAGEWVPNEDMTDIVDFIDVNPKTIRFFWEKDVTADPFKMGPHWAPYQKATLMQLEEARSNGQQIRNGAYVKLNELTFQYYAFNAAPGNPYGVPPFLAALNNIAVQRDMVDNMSQVAKKIALLGLIDMEVQSLQMLPNETQSDFQARASSYLQQYADLAVQMLDDGAIIHFDDAKVNSKDLSSNAAGVASMFTQNEEQVFSGLKSMPSVQGRSYCVVPETRVLTADLRWVKAGELELGDELIGFDEDLGKGRGRGSTTRYRRSTVEVNRRIQLPCVRVVTDQGEITVSKQHPLVARHKTQTDRVWRDAGDLQPGDKLIWFGEPWETDRSYEAGYLAGIFDGEGTLGYGGSGKNGTLTMAQLEGTVMDETVMMLKELGYESNTCWNTQANGKIIGHLRLLGGKYETMRFLGEVRPYRLLAKAHQAWEGHSLRNGSTDSTVRKDVYATVVRVEDVGVKTVVALQTSSRTFISEGLLSHNSTTETYAGVAYDIMVRNSIRYQRAAKMMIEYGYRLMADLWGAKIKDLRIQFYENKSLQRLQIAQAVHVEIINELMLWAAGITDQVVAAHNLGYPQPKTPLDDVPNAPWFAAGTGLKVAPPFAEGPENGGEEEGQDGKETGTGTEPGNGNGTEETGGSSGG